MALGCSRFKSIARSAFPKGFALAAESSDTSDGELQHEKWLKLTVEDALEPDLPICDPHHHLNPTYLPKHFLADIDGGHNIVKTVFIESVRNKELGPIKMTPLEETQFIVRECTGLNAPTEVAAGIVGYADLMAGNDALPLLEAHLASGEGRFRGIRLARGNVTSDTNFREAYGEFKRLNLCLDVYVPHSSLGDLAELARAFPDIPIIINHIGNPSGIGAGGDKTEAVMKAWKPEIKSLAACGNIFMKLGGVGMTAFGFGWHQHPAPPDSKTLAAGIGPSLSYCIEQFGTDRCMFESNFPVDKESFSYTVLWNAFKRMTKDYSDSERSDLFYNTAAKVYRL
jgi:predicted TIM-barrel fold metal-dependent hydrolase